MTKAQRNIRRIDQLLREFADGFVFIGFDPETHESMTCVSVPDDRAEIALNAVANGILQAGGVGALRDQIKEKEKEGE